MAFYVDEKQQKHLTFLFPMPSGVKFILSDMISSDTVVTVSWEWQFDLSDITAFKEDNSQNNGICAAAKKSLEFAYEAKQKKIIAAGELKPRSVVKINLPEKVDTSTALFRNLKTTRSAEASQFPACLWFYDAKLKNQEHEELPEKTKASSFG